VSRTVRKPGRNGCEDPAIVDGWEDACLYPLPVEETTSRRDEHLVIRAFSVRRRQP
jgi:hypothetical protein